MPADQIIIAAAAKDHIIALAAHDQIIAAAATDGIAAAALVCRRKGRGERHMRVRRQIGSAVDAARKAGRIAKDQIAAGCHRNRIAPCATDHDVIAKTCFQHIIAANRRRDHLDQAWLRLAGGGSLELDAAQIAQQNACAQSRGRPQDVSAFAANRIAAAQTQCDLIGLPRSPRKCRGDCRKRHRQSPRDGLCRGSSHQTFIADHCRRARTCNQRICARATQHQHSPRPRDNRIRSPLAVKGGLDAQRYARHRIKDHAGIVAKQDRAQAITAAQGIGAKAANHNGRTCTCGDKIIAAFAAKSAGDIGDHAGQRACGRSSRAALHKTHIAKHNIRALGQGDAIRATAPQHDIRAIRRNDGIRTIGCIALRQDADQGRNIALCGKAKLTAIAKDHVIACARIQTVISNAAQQNIAAAARDQLISCAKAAAGRGDLGQQTRAPAAQRKADIRRIADQHILSGIGRQAADRAIKRVAAHAADHNVIARAATQHIAAAQPQIRRIHRPQRPDPAQHQAAC